MRLSPRVAHFSARFASPATCRRPPEPLVLPLGHLFGWHVSHLPRVIGRLHDNGFGPGRRPGHLCQGDLDDAALGVEQGALPGQHVLQVLSRDATEGAAGLALR